MEVVRFLFLDVDGVLTDLEANYFLEDHHMPFDTDAVSLLNRLVETFPDLKIIISSTWRMSLSLEQLKAIFKLRGFRYPTNIEDVTPRLKLMRSSKTSEIYASMSVPRGCEIEEFLRSQAVSAYKYAIVDDDGDMLLWHRYSFVQTREILTEQDFEAIVRILT